MNLTAIGNQTITGTISALAGRWELIVYAAILIIAAFVVIYVLRNIIANAIIGIIALLAIKFLLGVNIPINGLTILVTVLGGLGGVAALLAAAFLGWL